MFWTLLFAHFVADFPLQTDAMVVAKKRLPGLTLHVCIHLVTMLVLLFGILKYDFATLWPAPVVVAAAHFLIDMTKTKAAQRWPDWIITPYVLDQVLHYAAILITAWWVDRTHGIRVFVAPAAWVVPAITFLVATYVTFITDKVVSLKAPKRMERVNAQGWHRLVGRGVMLAGLWLGVTTVWGILTLICGFCFHWFDLAGRRVPELLMDITIAGAAYAFLLLFA
ncbi:MAG: DUF3307 domain-containing protein [Acidobacteriota bacterium]|nr:DUF3307 domain-containing protein [Acidobacteriota bacterium]